MTNTTLERIFFLIWDAPIYHFRTLFEVSGILLSFAFHQWNLTEVHFCLKLN